MGSLLHCGNTAEIAHPRVRQCGPGVVNVRLTGRVRGDRCEHKRQRIGVYCDKHSRQPNTGNDRILRGCIGKARCIARAKIDHVGNDSDGFVWQAPDPKAAYFQKAGEFRYRPR